MTADVRSAFPELEDIDDDGLREAVHECLEIACEDNGVESLSSVEWFPPIQLEFGIEDESYVGHVRDVVGVACSAADSLERTRSTTVDYDLLRAGALVHDVSKLYEFDGKRPTRVFELNDHPYYGVYPVVEAGLPPEYAHIVLSHTPRTNVEPAFLEAELIQRADEIAASAIVSQATDDLRDLEWS